MDDDALIKERKEKALGFLKKNYQWLTYLVLAVIVFIAVRIRTLNLPGLRDVTTGSWTLGPDLDPFLFLRWAKYIVENGSLMAVDYMRYVPLGYETSRELILHPYMIAWFHNIASLFGSESVTQSAVLYPAFFFGITVIAFFFLVRKIFVDELGAKQANAIALVSSLFLSVLPAILPRTIAGIPEKESAAFFFLFAAFYFFISAWKSKQKHGRYVLAILAGLFTAGMSLVWGGMIYIFVTIALATFISFFFGQVNRKRFYVYSLWILTFLLFSLPFTSRYDLPSLISSSSTGVAFFVWGLIGLHLLINSEKLGSKLKLDKFRKIPPEVVSFCVIIILALIGSSIVFGPSFVPRELGSVYGQLVNPEGNRLGVTVAENRQPYFQEWANSFGPSVYGTPLFFWLFFVGSIYLFYKMMNRFEKRERWFLTSSYVIFLMCLVFSRYKQSSVLNGENFISATVYFLGVIVLLGAVGYYYYKHFKQGNREILKNIDYGLIFVFAFFFFGIISARGSVRTIMMLVPPASIIVSYFVVSVSERAIKDKKNIFVVVAAIIIVLCTIFSAYTFHNISDATAQNYIPSSYNQQWQKAMNWVRENTNENSVFGHWWDYGYWVQSIGERATVLDGGNAISYWNHFMGRHALTSPNERDALDFLYAHNTTHFLIDSSDIGKYTAFSSIGSDENYDRRSWVQTFLKDSSQTVERKNSTAFIYTGGVILDQDLIYEDEGGRIFLPGVNDMDMDSVGNVAGIAAILIDFNSQTNEIEELQGAYYYNGQQYNIPIRYAFYNGDLVDLGEGIEAGVFIMPRVEQSSGQIRLDNSGALFYLSERVVHSQLAKLYLYEEESDYFDLVHEQDSFVVEQLKANGLNIEDFVYFQGFRGPIKIWKISYPEDVEFNEEFISTEYPEELKVA